jgi:hypothetical protein
VLVRTANGKKEKEDKGRKNRMRRRYNKKGRESNKRWRSTIIRKGERQRRVRQCRGRQGLYLMPWV